MIREVVAGRPVYVTLSRGLDSTTIAVLAREWLGPVTAVTFSVREPGREEVSEDLRFARRVAADLALPLLEAHAAPDELLTLLDTVLLYGQDWRDFNVHCGLVNAALGAALGRAAAERRPVLLTGDTMNELMADYALETYRDQAYHRLPRLPAGRLRRNLVQGLDAGDREVGIFAHFALDTIQPYALCAGAYAALPAGVVERPEAKQRLVRAVMGRSIPAYVYKRPKVRAQAGGSGEMRGTLAVLADPGIDAAWLAARFATLFGLAPAELRQQIRAGLYRFTTSYPE